MDILPNFLKKSFFFISFIMIFFLVFYSWGYIGYLLYNYENINSLVLTLIIVWISGRVVHTFGRENKLIRFFLYKRDYSIIRKAILVSLVGTIFLVFIDPFQIKIWFNILLSIYIFWGFIIFDLVMRGIADFYFVEKMKKMRKELLEVYIDDSIYLKLKYLTNDNMNESLITLDEFQVDDIVNDALKFYFNKE